MGKALRRAQSIVWLNVGWFMRKKERKAAAPWSEKKFSLVWKALLILAVVVLAAATVFFWYQGGSESIDRLMNNYAAFALFLGLIAISFFVQYRFGVLERRKREVRRRVPILLVLGGGVVVFAAVLLWLQNPSASPRSILSSIFHTPVVLGSALGLILGGAVLGFFLLPKRDQKRIMNVFLIVLAAFLMFGGPTYLLYGGVQWLPLPYSLLVLLGLACFVVGIFLFLRLLGKESETEFSR